MSNNDALRHAAEKRLRSQSAFKRTAGIFVIVWIILVGVWLLSGRGYFWPAWVILGMGIGLVFMGWNAFGPRDAGPTSQQIDDEVRKMGGQS